MFKNASLISLSKLAEKAFSFLIIIQLTYIFTPHQVGQYFYYFSILSLLLPFMDFGLKKLFVTQWKESDNLTRQKLLGTMVFLKVLTGIACLLFAILFEFITHGSTGLLAISCCFLAIFSDEMGQLLRSPDHARQEYKIEIFVPFISKALSFIFIFMLAQDLVIIEEALCLFAAFNITGTFLSSFALKKCTPVFNQKFIKGKSKEILKLGFPFSITSLFVMMSFYVDSVILGFFSMEQTGIYNSAFRIILVFGVLSCGFSHVLFAKFCKSQKDPAEISSTLAKAFPIVLTLFSSIAIITAALSQSAINFVYSPEFKEAATILVILSPFIIFSACSNIMAHTLESCGQQKKVMTFNFITCSFNVVTNLIFIPIWGMYAAAVTTVLTELLNLLLSYRALRIHNIKPISKVPAGALLIAGVMILTGIAASQLSFLAGALFANLVFLPLFFFYFNNLKHKELHNAYTNG